MVDESEWWPLENLYKLWDFNIQSGNNITQDKSLFNFDSYQPGHFWSFQSEIKSNPFSIGVEWEEEREVVKKKKDKQRKR